MKLSKLSDSDAYLFNKSFSTASSDTIASGILASGVLASGSKSFTKSSSNGSLVEVKSFTKLGGDIGGGVDLEVNVSYEIVVTRFWMRVVAIFSLMPLDRCSSKKLSSSKESISKLSSIILSKSSKLSEMGTSG